MSTDDQRIEERIDGTTFTIAASTSNHRDYKMSLKVIDEKLLGHHDEEFYAIVGRSTCISALVEQQLRTLYAALTHADPRDLTARPGEVGLPISATITKSLDRLEAVVELQKDDFETYPGMKISFDKARAHLQDAGRLNLARNGYVHNIWTATQDGRLLGHRDTRRESPDNRSIVEPTIRDIQEHLVTLVNLCQQAPEVISQIVTWRKREKNVT